MWACVCEREGSGVERELSSAIMNGLCASVRRGGGKAGVRRGGGGSLQREVSRNILKNVMMSRGTWEET